MSEHSESRASMRQSGMHDGYGGKPDRHSRGDDNPKITPFSTPADDLIFEFKDREKLRKV